jgi:trehalose synthase
MAMIALKDIVVPPISVELLEPVIGRPRIDRLVEAARRMRGLLDGRTIWNVNSTASGGGVAEMLQVLDGYVTALGIDIRWTVIEGDPQFFGITKRLHNRIHGNSGGSGRLGPAEAQHYADVAAQNADALVDKLNHGDIVLLHDPQTAGLVSRVKEAGAHALWRCHIGADHRNEQTGEAWAFLRPHLEPAEAMIFSRKVYVPDWVAGDTAWIIPPSIDPLAPKNQELSGEATRSILAHIGILDAAADGSRAFTRRSGETGTVERKATIVADRLPGPDEPMVVQVSRWDRLKDMAGVMHGFADHVPLGVLVLVGPDVIGVSDDPEGAAVYADCVDSWRDLPAAQRQRVVLATLPLEDVDENAAMVNAAQRHAVVVVQKSLAEGFGLTVAEGMWKGRPVIGSAIGGIQDQIAAGTGILLPDPYDLAAFGSAVRGLLEHPDEADSMGKKAKEFVRDNFLGDIHLLRYASLLDSVLGT